MGTFDRFKTNDEKHTVSNTKRVAGAVAVAGAVFAGGCANGEGGGIGSSLGGNKVLMGAECENHEDKVLETRNPGYGHLIVPTNESMESVFFSVVEEDIVTAARMKSMEMKEINLRPEDVELTAEQKEQLLASIHVLENSFTPVEQEYVDDWIEGGNDHSYLGKIAVLNENGVVYNNGTIEGDLCAFPRKYSAYLPEVAE